jgi:hypothetical protein
VKKYLECFEEGLPLLVCVLDDLVGGALGQELHEPALHHQPESSRKIEEQS